MTRAEVDEVLAREAARLGRDPSLRELRRALGGRGSVTTLARHRAAVSVAHAAHAALGAEAADEAIAQRAAEADARVAAAAERAARAESSEARVTLERERALGHVEALGNRLDEWQRRGEAAEQGLEAALAEYERRETQLADQVREAAGRHVDLERELDTVRVEHGRSVDEATRAAERHRADLDAVRSANEAALREADERAAADAHAAERREAEIAETGRAEIAALRDQLEQARSETGREMHRADRLTERLDQLGATCATAEDRVRQKRERSARLDDELRDLRRPAPELDRQASLLGAVRKRLDETDAGTAPPR